jgi:Arc/MetJ family transcription regulator
MRTTVDLDEELLTRALAAAGPGATKTAVIEEGLRLVREKFEADRLEKKRTQAAMKALREAERSGRWVKEPEMDAFFDEWERGSGDREP